MSDIEQNTPIVDQTLAQLRDSLDNLDSVEGNESTDMDLYRAVEKQKIAIEDRISTLENLQLIRDTAAMQALVPALKQAKTDLDGVVSKICKASDVVDGVTKFLGIVDKLAAAAKAVV
jgi:hypothetical protein